VVHHAVQGAGFDVLFEPDFPVVFSVRVEREPVTETGAWEVLVGEQDCDAPPGAAAGDDHFGVRDVVDVGVRLQRWQPVAWRRAVADRLDGGLVQAGPATVAKDLAGFGVGAVGQGTRLAGSWRPPAVTEGGFDLGALPLKSWVAVRAWYHAGMVFREAAGVTGAALSRPAREVLPAVGRPY
jgi:hypothetical protein